MIFGDQRRFNKFGKRNSNLTERINSFITPQMKRDMDILIDKGDFGNKSELIRYCIRSYLDKKELEKNT